MSFRCWPDHAAEQNSDNRKRQCDGDDQRAVRRDHRLGFAFDDGRRRVLNDIGPARDNGQLRRLDIHPAIHPWRWLGSFIRQHLRHRLTPFGLIDCSLNLLDLTMSMALMLPASRYRVPAMVSAMPVEMYRTEMLTRFGLAHAGL